MDIHEEVDNIFRKINENRKRHLNYVKAYKILTDRLERLRDEYEKAVNLRRWKEAHGLMCDIFNTYIERSDIVDDDAEIEVI